MHRSCVHRTATPKTAALGEQIRLVCGHGHALPHNSATQSANSHEPCIQCGAKVYSLCDECGTPIPLQDAEGRLLPSHCRGCGHPYVWTNQILANVRRLVEQIEDLTLDDRCQLVRCIEDLVRGDLAADIKAEIARLLLDKAGAFADMTMWEIVHRSVPEHSRKRLWQPCAVKMEIRIPRLV